MNKEIFRKQLGRFQLIIRTNWSKDFKLGLSTMTIEPFNLVHMLGFYNIELGLIFLEITVNINNVSK
jgi:hypothetical protein